MKLLLDTHILLWLFGMPEVIPSKALALLEDRSNVILFSPVSLFEIAVKSMKGVPDFQADIAEVRDALRLHEVSELPLLASHTMQILKLPLLHKDPFDRLLLAQAISAGAYLLTVDRALLQYPSNVLSAR